MRAASPACRIVRGRVGRGPFPPEVALHLVRRACELPEQAGRSLSQWDCAELARQLVRDEVVASISPQTVQRVLAAQRLKPWRSHVWLHPRTPRDATFAAQVRAVADLLTRLLDEHEVVLSLDEMTSLQPRPRRSPHPSGPAGSPPPGRARVRPRRGHPPVRRLRHPLRPGLRGDHPTQAPGRVPHPPGAPRPGHPRLDHHHPPARRQRLGPSRQARPALAGTPIPASSPTSPRSTAPG